MINFIMCNVNKLVKRTLKNLQQMLQDFDELLTIFWALGIIGLTI